jgi:hypothetical protein
LLAHITDTKTGSLVSRRPARSNTLPHIEWISSKNGSRADDQMLDRAASYNPAMHLLILNWDFFVFNTLYEKFFVEMNAQSDKYKQEAIEDILKEWLVQEIAEAVMAGLALGKSNVWSDADVKRALSDESLTMVGMKVYNVEKEARRQIHNQLGKPKKTKKKS